MKKALIAVSVGTTAESAIRGCLQPIEDALRSACPDREVHRAFTSRPILHKLKSQGILIESETEALDRLIAEGFEDIVFSPTHFLPGEEYDRIVSAASGRKTAAPLLANDSDLDWMAELLTSLRSNENIPTLWMGHGSGSKADRLYFRLREKLSSCIYLACLDGACTLDGLLPQLDALPEKRIILRPLLLADGVHARTHLAGTDPHSWKSILTAHGFDVHVHMQGLGALPAVQTRFVEKTLKMLGDA